MDDDQPDWKPDMVKLESELMIDDCIPNDGYFTESSMDTTQHYSPAFQDTSGYSEELVKVKIEDGLLEESDTAQEIQPSVDFMERDPVEGMQNRKMCFSSCIKDEGLQSIDFPACGADIAQKLEEKAENVDSLTDDDSVFLHSEDFPRLSNYNVDSENGVIIGSPSLSPMIPADAVKLKSCIAQNYTESVPSKGTVTEQCAGVSTGHSNFMLSDIPFSEEKAFACNVCSARFKSKWSVTCHMLVHSNEKAFACEQCSARFKRKRELKTHWLSHSNVRNFACNKCSARFKRNNELQQHLIIHSDEKPFACDECFVRFKSKRALRTHWLSHSNETNFACNQCSARFKKNRELQNHMVKHSSEKMFVCNDCSASFKRMSNLQSHIMVHSAEKPFACDECSARFKRKWDLRSHKKVHSNEKAFVCNQCSAQFKRKSELQCHSFKHLKMDAATRS